MITSLTSWIYRSYETTMVGNTDLRAYFVTLILLFAIKHRKDFDIIYSGAKMVILRNFPNFNLWYQFLVIMGHCWVIIIIKHCTDIGSVIMFDQAAKCHSKLCDIFLSFDSVVIVSFAMVGHRRGWHWVNELTLWKYIFKQTVTNIRARIFVN